MSNSMGINRRGFVAAAFGLAGLPLLLGPFRPWLQFTDLASSEPLRNQLADILTHRQSAHVIGLAYLQATPGEEDANTLVDLIASGLPNEHRALRASAGSELRKLLAWRIQRDFEEERTTKLDGWIVSVTEARLCAVAVLREAA